MSQTTFTALNGAPTFLTGRKVVSKARAAPSKRASFQVSAALQQGRRLWAPGNLLQCLRALLLALVSPRAQPLHQVSSAHGTHGSNDYSLERTVKFASFGLSRYCSVS